MIASEIRLHVQMRLASHSSSKPALQWQQWARRMSDDALQSPHCGVRPPKKSEMNTIESIARASWPSLAAFLFGANCRPDGRARCLQAAHGHSAQTHADERRALIDAALHQGAGFAELAADRHPGLQRHATTSQPLGW